MPKVSILSRSYNNEKYVGRAIQSALAQTLEDFELVITDDASTDSNVDQIRRFDDPRISLECSSTRQGSVLAGLASLKRCTGQYIAILDTDDVWRPHLLETLVAHLDAHKDVLGAFGCAHVISADGNSKGFGFGEEGVGADRYQLLNMLFRRRRPLCTSAAVLRREIVERVGFFPPEFTQGHDTALWIKILFEGALEILPQCVVDYRQHAESAVGSPAAVNRGPIEHFELLFLYLERIKDAQLLLRIFPEAAAHPWPVNDRLVSFHLAHLALSCGFPRNSLFGLHVLHGLMSDPDMAAYLQTTANFSFLDLNNLKEQTGVFADGQAGVQLEQLKGELLRNQAEVEANRLPVHLVNSP